MRAMESIRPSGTTGVRAAITVGGFEGDVLNSFHERKGRVGDNGWWGWLDGSKF